MLRGLTEARCPECGTPFDPQLLAAKELAAETPFDPQQLAAEASFEPKELAAETSQADEDESDEADDKRKN